MSGRRGGVEWVRRKSYWGRVGRTVNVTIEVRDAAGFVLRNASLFDYRLAYGGHVHGNVGLNVLADVPNATVTCEKFWENAGGAHS